jgi:hypothetical protein
MVGHLHMLHKKEKIRCPYIHGRRVIHPTCISLTHGRRVIIPCEKSPAVGVRVEPHRMISEELMQRGSTSLVHSLQYSCSERQAAVKMAPRDRIQEENEHVEALRGIRLLRCANSGSRGAGDGEWKLSSNEGRVGALCLAGDAKKELLVVAASSQHGLSGQLHRSVIGHLLLQC